MNGPNDIDGYLTDVPDDLLNDETDFCCVCDEPCSGDYCSDKCFNADNLE